MDEKVSRRKFLTYSAATGLLLAAGDGLLENATVSAGQAITEVDRLTIWILTDNFYDVSIPEAAVTKRYRGGPGRSIHAEHGLAFFVETVVAGKTSTCMFDYGIDPVGVANNIQKLGLTPFGANAFSLSHGHWDHFGAATALLGQNQALLKKGAPFYVGEETFARRFSLRPGTTEAADLGILKKEDIEALGLKVVEVTGPTEIIPGGYFTGNVERVTAYEKVPPTLLVERGGERVQDDFKGEQSLFFNVKGKGLVILSGCSHSGIVNIAKSARNTASMDKVHAIMGGFHLTNAKPDKIQNTIADIKAMKPDFIVPTHCTGFDATIAFKNEMPNEFILNTAATRYTFGA